MKHIMKNMVLIQLLVVIASGVAPSIASASTVTVGSQEQATVPATAITGNIYQEDFGLSPEILKKIRTGGLTREEERGLSTPVRDLSMTRSLGPVEIIGIVRGVIALGHTAYKGGRYAARQAQIRYGLTPAKYKANRWKYRAAISATFGSLVALGFDDYFYGV